MPQTPAEVAVERILRRVDRVVREAELEAFAAPDEARALCSEARALAAQIRAGRETPRAPGRSTVPAARRVALRWLNANRRRINDVLNRLDSDRDIDGLVGCLAGLEHAAGGALQPLGHVRATGRWRLGRPRAARIRS